MMHSLCIMYCSMVRMTDQNYKSLGIAENNVLGQKVRKYAKNRGKLENLIFCMVFPFQRMLNNAVCTVPCTV